ncbi:MAG: GTP-binding protein, partial [Lachnospiraceae bacterium]|nr:GTP-binding protein [Lachnospiraceae bacterium]
HHHHDEDEHEHHHHHDEDEHEHHHHHDEDEHEHHHHHDEDEHEHHHHDHGPDCTCGCHDHDHHHHHADEIFTSWGLETADAYSKSEIENILNALGNEEEYGIVLRAKGMVPDVDGGWIHFDFVPEEINVRSGKSSVTGKFCVIGSNINEEKLEALFHK